MNRYACSVLAGFAATMILSLLMLLKALIGLMPDLNAVTMLAVIVHEVFGAPEYMVIGWLVHLAIGTFFWGPLFALLYGLLPGATSVAKGIRFALLVWGLEMILFMPMAKMGLFGLRLGFLEPAITLGMTLIWGWILGWTYGKLEER